MAGPTPEDATLILDHVLGDRSVPAAVVNRLLDALPFPSDPTTRLRRAILLRRLAADQISSSSLDTIQLLASLPATGSPIAAAHIAVAAFLAANASNFGAAARALFARRPKGRARLAVDEGGSPALASDQAIALVNQFEANVGNASGQGFLKHLWGKRSKTEELVKELLDAEWAAIGPSLLEAAAERIVGDGALADEATRVKLLIFAEEENTHEILSKLEEPTSSANPISTLAVEKVIDTLKTSCADLHSVVEDMLPASKAVADEVVIGMLKKGIRLNAAEEVRGQPTTCVAGPSAPNYKDKGPCTGKPHNSAPNDKDKGPCTGKPHNLMDWNPTARTSQWEESPGPQSLESSLRRLHLPNPRNVPVSPLPRGENKNKPRRPRKFWSLVEEEALRKGVEQYGIGNWKDILNNNLDIFIGRTAVDLKDKWRNMTKR